MKEEDLFSRHSEKERGTCSRHRPAGSEYRVASGEDGTPSNLHEEVMSLVSVLV